MKKLLLLALSLAFAGTAFAAGSVPLDVNSKPLPAGAFSGIFSVTPGTQGTQSVSATGKTGLKFNCTASATSGTAAVVKVGRNGSVSTYYNASSDTVWFGNGTGTTSITFKSYSTANEVNCAGYYW